MDQAVQKDLDGHQEEIDLYRKYSDWHGYVFYGMQGL